MTRGKKNSGDEQKQENAWHATFAQCVCVCVWCECVIIGLKPNGNVPNENKTD